MKNKFLLFLVTVLCCTSCTENNETWTAFWNKDTTLVGFRDKEGVEKIKPKFVAGFTSAKKFDDIIGVAEEINGEWKSYYLTKSGRMTGTDSMYVFDNVVDCESEGFIRFRDHKTEKVGLFNKNGDIVIPAEYNDMTRVSNGMVIALKGAEKKYELGGEHYSWVGGEELLVDINNNILIRPFKRVDNLNFFSLQISKEPSSDALRESFKGVDGQYYSFINFDREFESWLKVSLIDNFTEDNLLKSTFDEVTYWNEPEGWVKDDKVSFIESNFDIIKSRLEEYDFSESEYGVNTGGLDSFMSASNEFDYFYNNCGEQKSWIYPVKSVIITSTNDNNDNQQDHFHFLRTDDGYKLISVTID